MTVFTAFLSGLVFGLGLLLAGMSDPAKVLGFLDLAGAWDPSLALVMGGAIAVGLPAFALAARRRVSFIGAAMALPTARQVDRPLLLGGALFGVGWGIAGICPGPALVLAGMGERAGLLFAAAMLVGMVLFEAWVRWRQRGVGRASPVAA
jgi:uncharacterized membrane protein YedE/YeeE